MLVGVRLGVVGLVLLPQQHQRHALAAELTVDLGKVGVDVIRVAAIGALAREQASLQLGLGHRLDLWGYIDLCRLKLHRGVQGVSNFFR